MNEIYLNHAKVQQRSVKIYDERSFRHEHKDDFMNGYTKFGF